MPNDYQPAFKELIYTIEQADQAQKIEVEIRDNSLQKCVGLKRFTGEKTYNVNIAPYVQQQFVVEPINSKICEFVRTEARIVAAAIVIDAGAATPKRVFTAARCETPIHTKLSSSPANKKIAVNEIDEIALITTQATLSATALFTDKNGTQRKITIAIQFATGGGMYALVVAMPDLAQKLLVAGAKMDDQIAVEIVISVDAIPKITQSYTIGQQDPATVRICWVNQFGAIDYYSCSHVEQTHAENSANQTKICRKIVSQYENSQNMFWLAQIGAATKVWEVINDKFKLIAIDCQQVIIQSEVLSRLEISEGS